jgi:putative toxin-antitoxin system antitoxin component (TIGR02293 family)
MAAARSSVLVRDRAEPSPDFSRFLEFLQNGAPGPHAYVALLGLDTYDTSDLLRALKDGLPYSSLDRFQHSTDLPFDIVAELVDIPRRTLARRKREGRLSPEESDRLVRAARIVGGALILFAGDLPAATEWLGAPQPALGGRPLDLARTDLGAREVEALVGRLLHGVFS